MAAVANNEIVEHFYAVIFSAHFDGDKSRIDRITPEYGEMCHVLSAWQQTNVSI